MSKIEFSKFIDGVEVKAETTFAHPMEFGIRLRKPNFMGQFCSPQLAVNVSNNKRYIDLNCEFSQLGWKTACEMTDGLYAGYRQALSFKYEIEGLVLDLAFQILELRDSHYSRLVLCSFDRRSLKRNFEENDISIIEYTDELMRLRNKILDIRHELASKIEELIKLRITTIKGLIDSYLQGPFNANHAIMSHIHSLVIEKADEINCSVKKRILDL